MAKSSGLKPKLHFDFAFVDGWLKLVYVNAVVDNLDFVFRNLVVIGELPLRKMTNSDNLPAHASACLPQKTAKTS